MKSKRQAEILRLIHQYEIETQEDLAEKLNERGYRVTQATVSRDIREMKLTKIAGESGKIRYEAVPVDVAAWASEQGSDNPELLNFAAFAAESFDRRGIVQAASSLEESDFGEAERAAMTDYAVAIQRGVFSGDLSGIEDLDPDGRTAALWAGTGNFHGYYMSTVAPEIGMDFRRWEN